MSTKRKISIRKILQVFVGLTASAACIVALQSASRIESDKTVKGVSIEIMNGNRYHFLDQQQVKDIIINNRHIDIQHVPIRQLDIHNMEHILAANPWVADAQAYLDNTHMLHVLVTQRVPVVRMFQQDGNSYYLDTTLSSIPLSGNYVQYTAVVTNVPEVKNDSERAAMRGSILSLVKYIESDTFWNAQISQVIVDSVNNYELVPVLGNQRIVFGDTSDMPEKFSNLFLFYKTVLNKIGWDKYDRLDVRFKGQVLASPALPYKGPVDKAMSNINWAQSILDNAARQKDEPDVEMDIPPEALPQPVHHTAPPQPQQVQKDKAMHPVIDHEKKLQPPAPIKVQPEKKKMMTKDVAKPASKPTPKSKSKQTHTTKTEKQDNKKTKTPKYLYKGN